MAEAYSRQVPVQNQPLGEPLVPVPVSVLGDMQEALDVSRCWLSTIRPLTAKDALALQRAREVVERGEQAARALTEIGMRQVSLPAARGEVTHG